MRYFFKKSNHGKRRHMEVLVVIACVGQFKCAQCSNKIIFMKQIHFLTVIVSKLRGPPFMSSSELPTRELQ